jgi:hypothetical protein
MIFEPNQLICERLRTTTIVMQSRSGGGFSYDVAQHIHEM